MAKGICVICGTPFTFPKGKKLTCSPECAKALNNKRARERYQEDTKRKRHDTCAIKMKSRKRKKNALDADIKAANKAGLSYGEYMAKKDGLM